VPGSDNSHNQNVLKRVDYYTNGLSANNEKDNMEQTNETQKIIDDLQTMTNAPASLTSMQPHERVLVETIVHSAYHLMLGTTELITALKRITAYIASGNYKNELQSFKNDGH